MSRRAKGNPYAARLKDDFDRLVHLGLVHLYPVGSNKRPIGKWANGPVNYVVREPTGADRDRWAADSRTEGWAVLCGNRARKLMVLDIEAAGMTEPAIRYALDSLPRSCVRRSPSGGVHAFLVVSQGEPVPTQHLAVRTSGDQPILLAEVRGVSKLPGANGAYAVVTGPGRPELAPDFAPHAMSRTDIDALLAAIRVCDQRPDGQRQASADIADGHIATERVGYWERSVDDLIEVLAGTTVARNNTLNAISFVLGLRLLLDPATERRLLRAALCTGLSRAEAERTLRSAKKAAQARWTPYAVALGRLDARLASAKGGLRLRPAADYLARRAVLTGKSELGMSYRQLSEGLGVTPRTAGRVLNGLCEKQFLLRLPGERGETSQFRILLPGDFSDAVVLNPPAVKGRMGHLASLPASEREAAIRSHAAFQRFQDGPWLPPTCADLLFELERGPASAKALTDRMGRDRGTVRRNLTVLESAGLATHVDGQWRLLDDDVPAGLDRWAESMDIAWRPAVRRLLHEAERATYRAEPARRTASAATTTPIPADVDVFPVPTVDHASHAAGNGGEPLGPRR